MKIRDIYAKHANRLIRAAAQGRPYAALTYGPQGTQSRFRTFATKSAASDFLKAHSRNGSGRDGMVVLTDAERKGLAAYYVRPTTGFKSFY